MSRRRARFAVLITLLVLVVSAPVLAGVDVTLNGEPLPFSSAVLVEEDRVLVPVDALSYYLDGSSSFDPVSGFLRVFCGGTVVQMKVGDKKATIRGETVEMDAAPVALDGRVLVPLRFIAEALKMKVAWNEELRTVELMAEEVEAGVKPYPGEPIVSYTPEEFDLLVRCISSEAGNQPFEGMVAVGAVVINRMLNPDFPDTINDVIYQPGQFSVVADNRINLPVKEGAVEAARRALAGEDPTGGALYFYNPVMARAKFVFTRNVLKVIGDHRFCD
jgi:N-acetylmuramoyl-L-alanine amidase